MLDIVLDVLENGPIEEKITYEMNPVTKANIADYVTD